MLVEIRVEGDYPVRCTDIDPFKGTQFQDFGRVFFVPPIGIITERPFFLSKLGFLQALQIGKIQVRELLLTVGDDIKSDLAFDRMDDNFHIGILHQGIAAIVAGVAEYFRLEYVFQVQG